MRALRFLILVIFGVLLARNAGAEEYKSNDEKDPQQHLPDGVKDLDETIERIRRQIGAFGVGIGVFGARHAGPIGNPYYGGPYGNPYFGQPYGNNFHDRRFGEGFAGNFYGR
ncbi:uncharacterized protein LOC108139153 [Drosophila elegans]|uniref:uncharacterized protein LOC108139153 n=1 Tax=Drosophila elegans TaxID=30023 RepID=UPI0007E62955|nr:uncharacterized protein LOC108139153 [Drosophila elegans]